MEREQQLALLQPRAAKDESGVIALMVARLNLVHGKREVAARQLEELAGRIDADTPMEVERQRLLAQAYHTMGQLDRSRAAYERVLEASPDDLMALNNLAFLLADDLKDPQTALPLARRAVEVADNAPQQRANVLDTLGWVQHRAGDSQAAVETLTRSVRLYAMVANHQHLARVYLETQRPSAAREELMKARQIAEDTDNQQAIKVIDEMLRSIDSPAASAER